MIAEVPSIAIEKVFIRNNTSIIQDEVLAHRLGLIPLKVDPDSLVWFDPSAEPVVGEDGVAQDPHTDSNTLVFHLNIECKRNPNPPAGSTNPDELYINSNVYARDLKFEIQGSQDKWIQSPVTTANPDILIAKLRPGQEISLTAYAILGIGADHAKFSPVATASYRLLPTIEIIGDPITGDLAKKFQQCFPKGVIDIDSSGKAVVADARRDTVSREVLRHEEFKDKVKLGRRRDHFIFNVESTGAMTPEEIFVKSINHLRNKATELLHYDLSR